MALSDATLSADSLSLAMLFFADFADLPIRAAYAPFPVLVPAGLTDSDADCAGFSFPVTSSDVLSIGTVSQGEGGSDTLSFTLHADAASPALLTAIENPALYVGRRVRVWLAVCDLAGSAVQLRPLYRGYMTQPAQEADDSQFIVTMEAENYLSLISAGQGRTYVQSTLYDAGDLSGAAMKGQQNSVPGVPGGGEGGRYNGYDSRFEP